MHKSVLLKETVDLLNIKMNGIYIDATLGLGGHAKEILARGGRVIGIDDDPKMIRLVKKKLGGGKTKRLKIIEGNFREIDKYLADLKINSAKSCS
mgnify:CR=1 FL=1